MILTFLILGWTFYEMSGGADFVPETREMAAARQPQAQPQAQPQPTVTRPVETPTLISLSLPVRDAAPEPEVEARVIAPIAPATESKVTEVTSIAPADLPVAEPPPDVRAVAGSRVNMRAGPGTNFGVVNAFNRGTEAEVLMVDDTGWAQIRILDTGQTGWMAERLLSDS